MSIITCNEPSGFIPTITAQVKRDFDVDVEEGVYKAVCKLDVKVDKAELMKLLRGDRHSYDKGYENGMRDAVKRAHWEGLDHKFIELDEDGCTTRSAFCSNCREWLVGSEEYGCKGYYCPNCGAKMMAKENEWHA